MGDDDGLDDLDFEEYKAKWNQNRKKEFDFDEWCKDLDTHPAFMTKLPEEGSLSEAAEALQALKYDQESTLEEQAKSYKDDGNAHFAKKKYKESIVAYTEGLKLRCSDVDLNATLANNRSASHFQLGNYRSAFRDCVLCRKFKPDYAKAFNRGVDCLMKLNCPLEALRWIDEASCFVDFASSKEFVAKRQLIENAIRVKNKELRKAKIAVQKQERENNELRRAFQMRNLHIRNENHFDKDFDMSSLVVSLTQCESCKVFLNQDHQLIWPVLFLYPEFGTTDFIREFNEVSTFQVHFKEIFAEKPTWDIIGCYSSETVEIYFESRSSPETLIAVPVQTHLKDVLSNSEYSIFNGLPSFLILSTTSTFRKNYLTRYVLKTL